MILVLNGVISERHLSQWITPRLATPKESLRQQQGEIQGLGPDFLSLYEEFAFSSFDLA